MIMEAQIVKEEVLITDSQQVINDKLADGTYRVKQAVPLTSMQLGENGTSRIDVAMGNTAICYILAKLCPILKSDSELGKIE